jgi:hypothetical protein
MILGTRENHLDTRDMAKNKDFIKNSEIDIPLGFLTLKEAADKTDYTPDYIGQLIRAGKIEGKQIYSSVAWVANEHSLKQYLEARGKDMSFDTDISAFEQLPEYMRPLLYLVIAASVVFIVILLHVLSVAVDHALSRSYEETSRPITVSNDQPL